MSWRVTPLAPGLVRFESITATSLPKSRRAAFLDRDGVLNELVVNPLSGTPESPLAPHEVRLIPGAAAGVRSMAAAGYLPVCVSNQPASAKGEASLECLLDVHARVLELLAAEGASIAASYLCLHHPQGVVRELAVACACRKPQPGMLLRGAAAIEAKPVDCWMVGDTDGDVRAGKTLGCRTALALYPGSDHKRLLALDPDVVAESLGAAAPVMLSTG